MNTKWVLAAAMAVVVVLLVVALRKRPATDNGTRIEGSVHDTNGAAVPLSDAAVTLSVDVPGCGHRGDAAKLGPGNTFSFSCAKEPQARFAVTISKPGFLPTSVWVTPHQVNRFSLSTTRTPH
jgi:hypothetical protein